MVRSPTFVNTPNVPRTPVTVCFQVPLWWCSRCHHRKKGSGSPPDSGPGAENGQGKATSTSKLSHEVPEPEVPFGAGKLPTLGIASLSRFLSSREDVQWRTRDDEVTEKAGGTSCLVRSDFLEGGKAIPPQGESSGRPGHVGVANLDKFGQRAAFEEKKEDTRFQTESFVPASKAGEGNQKSRKRARMKASERLLNLDVRPPKITGSPRSVSAALRSFQVSRHFNPGAVTQKFPNERSKRGRRKRHQEIDGPWRGGRSLRVTGEKGSM